MTKNKNQKLPRKEPNHRERAQEILDKFMKTYGNQVDTVLEIGCGKHNFKRYFNKQNIIWHGTDVGPVTGKNILYGDFNNLPFPDDWFDLVFGCHCFEHSCDPIRTLRELRRVSKKYVLLITPYPCPHQILYADNDHIFVLNKDQMQRLYSWVGINKVNFYYNKTEILEQNWDVVSIGCVDKKDYTTANPRVLSKATMAKKREVI